MGNKQKKTQKSNLKLDYTATKILTSMLDPKKLLEQHPEIFNFDSLDILNKVALLRFDFDYFNQYIKSEILPAHDRAYIYLSELKLAKSIKFSEEDLVDIASVSPDRYAQLVSKDKSFIRKDLFSKLPKANQDEFFIQNPHWVIDNVGPIQKISSNVLAELSKRNQKFIDQYITNYSELTTTSGFWVNMIGYDEKYMKIFLENTKTCLNKTEVRRVIGIFPEILKILDEAAIANSKLTCKEWVLLIRSILNRYTTIFKDFKFSKELSELISLDLTAELLSGQSKLSKKLTNSLDSIRIIAD